MAEVGHLEVTHNTLANVVFISTNDSDACDTVKGPHGILFHYSQVDQSLCNVTLTNFKLEWAGARNDITQAVSNGLKLSRETIERRIDASIQPDLC